MNALEREQMIEKEREKSIRETPEERRQKTVRYQIYMFLLCYSIWIGVHIQREFWAMSKRTIKQKHKDLKMSYFAAIDFSLFQTYSFAQLVTGAVGDAYPKKLVLSLSFTIQGATFFFVGMGGKWFSVDMQSGFYYFCFCFFMVGLIQSVDFPCLISTMGAWTERSTRGTVTGLWGTCSQVGNIIGLQLAAILLASNGSNWVPLMFIVTAMYFVFAVAIYFGFIADPEEVGIQLLDKDGEKKELAANKEVELF